MLYSLNDVTVSFQGESILSHIDFEIKGNEKIAIVGRNGVGKTTLLKVMAGEIEPDRDDKRQGEAISRSRQLSIGMLHQTMEKELDKTVEEILEESYKGADKYSKERFYYEMEYDKLFVGFGLKKEDKKKKLREFSGGEKTKIGLIKLFLAKPDILLLDEPTNNLDMKTVEWLEEYIKGYEKAVVLVSHDRFFLDRVVDVVYELSDSGLTRYAGNYTKYKEERIKAQNIAIKEYENQQKEIKRLEELIEKFKHKPNKASFARSKKTMLEKMERVNKPREHEAHIFTGDIEPDVIGSKWVFETEKVKVGYDKPLFNISLRVKRGQKIGIIGDNGVGKSTFLKTLMGEISPLDGKITYGNNITTGYFRQDIEFLNQDKTVIEYYREAFPEMTEKELRESLSAYLFTGKDFNKKVSALSGGEKSRLVLCKILTQKPNFLILDEPTNHMDIPAKETIESALKAYKGTIIFVSHDRYFLNEVAKSLLIIEDDDVLLYPFNYNHYLTKLKTNKEYIKNAGISAMVIAKDQAMVDNLRKVPKPERHESKYLNTDEAYVDWKLRLIGEPMEEVKERFEIILEKRDSLMEKVNNLRLKTCMGEEWEDEKTLNDLRNLEQELSACSSETDKIWEEWNMSCLNWYDVYEELMD